MKKKVLNALSPILYRIERLDEDKYGYLLIGPMLFVLSALAFYPLLRTFWVSLHSDDLRGTYPVGEFSGFDTYSAILSGEMDIILSDPFFSLSNPLSSALGVTLFITAVSVTIGTLLGLGMALILNKEFRGRAVARMIVLLPWSIPIVIQGMIFYLLFQPSISFLVDPLHSLGLFSSNPLVSTRDSIVIVTLIDIWRKVPFIALIILAGLASVDQSLYNVARVAGASKWQQFRLITLPLIKPVVLIGMIFYTISSMKVYGVVEASTGCSTVPTLSCLVVDTFRMQRWATASAIAFLTALLIAGIIMFYLINFRSEVGTNE
ncbi:carbohydrate ABC transporter permease [Halopiger xanaduensis]|uniref:ABC-type transporter, integral membrane subunit n=1 Tax=Halopiger xanaduensis (strain DSM 18323 / JCM 14033 / SH-6) TaxID=797210 RepID=F8DDB8_HALXS|nr:sugar ABC transporter permease [Halopiger xanaduensis]AEH39007.1 ABC-type transporter, integral membrane subunit [Halopiger xanaduensis SH-6]